LKKKLQGVYLNLYKPKRAKMQKLLEYKSKAPNTSTSTFTSVNRQI